MRVLVIAPHPDDEVLGCGGTIAKHSRQGDDVHLCLVTTAYTPDWSEQYLKNRPLEIEKASKILNIKETYFLDYPTVKLDTIPQKELNEAISKVVDEIRPETVYIPYKGDLHKDHQSVFGAAMVATRPKLGSSVKWVYSYEILSETGWAGPLVESAFMPNMYVDISETLEIKLRAMAEYKSELKEYPHPRSLEAISVLAKFRGATIGVKAAEAFMLIRGTWI